MAAISICLELFENGDHIVCSEDLYGGSVRIFGTIGEKRGISFSYVDTSDARKTEQAILENTKALYIETPSNPTMQVTDLRKMKELADKYGLLVIVDNTFLSPYFQNPLKLGADLVIHSGTKFLGGHNDTLAGILCTSRKDLAEKIRYTYKTVGSCLSPFDSFLLLRGIKTLPIRMERSQENAKILADWLKSQKEVTKVYYVGLEDHPGYEVNKSQASGSGSMIAFRTDTKETAIRILEHVKLISYAESLGGVESLITYPMLQTHGDVPVEVRERLGITDCLLRLSVGIEKAEDLIEDLRQAMK
jgi:cystathionine gamma-synthase